MSFLTPPTSMALDDPEDIWVSSNPSLSFQANEDILATAMGDVIYNGVSSSDPWEKMSIGNEAIASQVHQTQELNLEGIYQSEEPSFSGQCGEDISPLGKIRTFNEFDAIFAEKEERPLHMAERLENRLATMERHVQRLERHVETVGSVLTTVLNTATCLKEKVKGLDEHLQEIIRREKELMEKVLEYSDTSQAST